jgi:hypothetical protein
LPDWLPIGADCTPANPRLEKTLQAATGRRACVGRITLACDLANYLHSSLLMPLYSEIAFIKSANEFL